MKIFKSTAIAWAMVLICTVLLVITCTFRPPWWAYSYVFFLFLGSFCHAVACTFARINPTASKRLDRLSFFADILAVIAIIAEAVAFSLM